MFDQCDKEYNEDFYSFLIKNMDIILRKSLIQENLAIIQQKFSTIQNYYMYQSGNRIPSLKQVLDYLDSNIFDHHSGCYELALQVKNAGVEFVILRVGSTKGTKGDYFVDGKFKQNIKRANEVGMPVGIYFYSYATSKEKAIADANWILEQIKDYKVELPIAFDWENWSFYNDFNLSFFGLTDMANSFLDVFKEAGYEGMLYSSRNYLEQIWLKTDYPIWLAHYTYKTSYSGPYSYWQMCNDGRVDGIYGDVDINIRYK